MNNNLIKKALTFILILLPLASAMAWEQGDRVPLYDESSRGSFELDTEPVIQHLETNEAAVLWTTTRNAFSWLEFRESNEGENNADWKKILRPIDGIYNAANTLHRAYLSDLKAEKKYEYRIQAKQIRSFGWAPHYGKEFTSNTYYFKTPPSQPESYYFAVLNDLHENDKAFSAHAANAKEKAVDGLYLNGDILSVIQDHSNIVDHLLKPAAPLQGTTPIYLVRGNHETRGKSARELNDFIHTKNGKSYRLIIRGETALLFTDTGEDKPDDNIEYYGLVDFDSFRTEEEAWFAKVFASSEWKNAKYKIAIGHIPIWQKEDKRVYVASREWQHRWQKLYNKNGVQLVLAGHTHLHEIIEPNTMGNNYLLAISGGNGMSNNLMFTCKTGNNEINLTAWYTSGEEAGNWIIPVN